MMIIMSLRGPPDFTMLLLSVDETRLKIELAAKIKALQIRTAKPLNLLFSELDKRLRGALGGSLYYLFPSLHSFYQFTYYHRDEISEIVAELCNENIDSIEESAFSHFRGAIYDSRDDFFHSTAPDSTLREHEDIEFCERNLRVYELELLRCGEDPAAKEQIRRHYAKVFAVGRSLSNE